MASSRSSSSSGRVIPLPRLRGTAAAISPPLRGRAGWGLTGSWRRHHETGALVGTTRECGPTPSPPFVGGEPVGITRAVDRRARDERPYHRSGRLQRRFADVAGAPFDADPRRGERRRRDPVGIVYAGSVACDRVEAHPNAAPLANARPLIDPE